MFYDPLEEKILDYVDGKEDLNRKIIRAIGNPHERIKEDRLRMVRAIRLSCRFNFAIEEKTQAAIIAHAKELFPAVAIERIWQEFTKGHAFAKLAEMIYQLHELGLLQSIFPSLEKTGLEEKLLPTKKYPKEAPVIATVLALFPNFSLEDALDLCKSLKLPNTDLQFVSFLNRCKHCVQENPAQQSRWLRCLL